MYFGYQTVYRFMKILTYIFLLLREFQRIISHSLIGSFHIHECIFPNHFLKISILDSNDHIAIDYLYVYHIDEILVHFETGTNHHIFRNIFCLLIAVVFLVKKQISNDFVVLPPFCSILCFIIYQIEFSLKMHHTAFQICIKIWTSSMKQTLK